MGQSNLTLPFSKLANGALGTASLDSGTGKILLTSLGGNVNALDVTAAAVIKATPGRLAKIIIVNPGTAGNITFNDCATTGAAATANLVWSVAFNATGVTAGAVFVVDFPFNTGIVLSAISTGGVLSISYI